MDYETFIDGKTQSSLDHGFDMKLGNHNLFDFQEHLVSWALRKGRSAIFADCGLGKTLMQLVWADEVLRHDNKSVLIVTPLAVSYQTEREAEKFGVKVRHDKVGTVSGSEIIVTNYENLHKFNPNDFSGVVCDESSILKNFDGVRRSEVVSFMRKVKYRLLATATAAPNDYTELGNSSEALGGLGHVDMLTKFFKNDQNNISARRLYGEVQKFRFKGHAEIPFWRWVSSWSMSIRKPSDIGFDDIGFVLPPITTTKHLVEHNKIPEGMLFSLPAVNLHEQRKEKKNTINERCSVASELASGGEPAIIWCHMNDEGNLLREMIPESVEVSGSDSDDVKESKFLEFIRGESRVLITKPKIGAFGLNLQHCNKIVYFPSHSYEQYYQAVRRCYRFGQQKPVEVNIVMTTGEEKIVQNMDKKMKQADTMFSNLVTEMNRSTVDRKKNTRTKKEEVPAWL